MRILFVDDQEEECYLAETLLKGSGYEVETAANGMEALEKLRAGGFDMIISDVLMPVMDGFQLCRECKGDEKLKDIPFVFYTATYVDERDEELTSKVGAEKFIRKPIEPEEFVKIIQGVFREAEEGKTGPEKHVLAEEREVLKLYSERLIAKLEKKTLDLEAQMAERQKAQQRLEDAFIDLTETVARTIEARDPYTSGHQRKVAELAQLVGEKLGLSADRLQGLYVGALLHDIGKMWVPESILAKPGKLSDEEWSLVQAHARRGYEILKDNILPWPVADMALHHQERLDGSGYPDGLSGDELSLEVRILGVCDLVEAMGSHRPYRPARSREEVLAEIKSGRGTKYDPRVVDAMLDMIHCGALEPGWTKERIRAAMTSAIGIEVVEKTKRPK